MNKLKFNYINDIFYSCKHPGISRLNPEGGNFRMLGISILGGIHVIILGHHTQIIIV